ncbi:MAG: DUF1080 domain-containing protein [Verrucomicrobiota bacterium]
MKTLAILTLAAAPLLAEHHQEPHPTKENKYAHCPKLPNVPYTVHDTTRPQPRKVTSAGAVPLAAPSDAKVLFDGSNTDAWTGGPWKIENGILIASPGNILTKEKFGDCQVHLEYRVPANRKVVGQKGGNSGIFLMNRYEVQIGESHSNYTYPDGQAGAIYGQYPPLVNPATPQGEWQSYDIIFKAPVYKNGKMQTPAQMTVLFNGVVVQAAQNLQGPTMHQKLTSYPDNHPAEAPIRLQWHSDPIEYRNIWVRPLGQRDQ